MDAAPANLPFQVDLQVSADAGELPDGAEWSIWAATALNVVTAHEDKADRLTVRIVGNAESRQLNKAYRQTDSATNVLAFPGLEKSAVPTGEALELGDLVICLPVVYKEAQLQHKRPLAHMAHLVVHGTLHLLGFDHADDETAEHMEHLETQIMRRLGFPDPYAAQ